MYSFKSFNLSCCEAAAAWNYNLCSYKPDVLFCFLSRVTDGVIDPRALSFDAPPDSAEQIKSSLTPNGKLQAIAELRMATEPKITSAHKSVHKSAISQNSPITGTTFRIKIWTRIMSRAVSLGGARASADVSRGVVAFHLRLVLSCELAALAPDTSLRTV